jgi:hypothetical protein
MQTVDDGWRTKRRNPLPKRVIAVLVVLFVLVAALAVTSVYFYSQYESEVNVNSQNSQLENGISKAAADNCEVANFRAMNPSPYTFDPLLPKSLGNATGAGIGLVDYWPVPINSSTFQVYEVWSVGYALNGDFTKLYHINMLWIVNCTLG